MMKLNTTYVIDLLLIAVAVYLMVNPLATFANTTALTVILSYYAHKRYTDQQDQQHNLNIQNAKDTSVNDLKKTVDSQSEDLKKVTNKVDGLVNTLSMNSRQRNQP